MKFRAVIKKSGDWWIGWLIDLPAVNAQERSKEQLIESLRIAAEDMLNTAYEPKKSRSWFVLKCSCANSVFEPKVAPLERGDV